MTEEFLRLLWIIEATVDMHFWFEQVLDEVIAGECFKSDELPEPTDSERKLPARELYEQGSGILGRSPWRGSASGDVRESVRNGELIA